MSQLPNWEKIFDKLAEAYQPTEFRSNVKLWGSAILGLSLWSLLIAVAWSNFKTTKELALKLSSIDPVLDKEGNISLIHQEKVNLIEQSISAIESTTDRNYTFLTPIVTAITGYFFVSASARPRGGPPKSQPPTPEPEIEATTNTDTANRTGQADTQPSTQPRSQ